MFVVWWGVVESEADPGAVLRVASAVREVKVVFVRGGVQEEEDWKDEEERRSHIIVVTHRLTITY
jgi:hypothetical protein